MSRRLFHSYPLLNNSASSCHNIVQTFLFLNTSKALHI